jgi:hypothetical protein
MSITLVLVRLNFGLNSTILCGRKLLGGRASADAGDDDASASFNKSDIVRAQRQEILEKQKRGRTLDCC